MGCELTVTSDKSNWTITGNQCKIGDKYGKEEMTNPTRNITTSIPIQGGDTPMLSLKTSRPIPKGSIMACMEAVKKLTVEAPIYTGDIVLKDVAGTGADIVATRTVEKIKAKE